MAFSLCGLKSVSKKTIIYIDGYNLYYSRLKNTPFKWLDVVALFCDQILMPQDPTAEVVAVKYFTECIEVINGFHIFEHTALPAYVEGQAPDKNDLAPVWMIEEKQTDVEPVLKLLASDAPDVRVGLVLPLREPGTGQQRFSNKRLTGTANWVRHYIRDDELAASQLPQNVPTKKETCWQACALVINTGQW